MWGLIEQNISTIKDLLWIIFTFIATLIAILTYRRAKYTLLQPLRTEVVKRQTELLVQVWDFFDEIPLFSLKLDYMDIINLNMYMLLKEYGFTLNQSDSDAIDRCIGGGILLHDSEIFSSIEEPELFQEKNFQNESEIIETARKKYEQAKKGDVNVGIVYFTKRYFKCWQQMESFKNNPFIPQKIKRLIEDIMQDVRYNLTNVLRVVLEEFVVELCSSKYKPTDSNPVKVQGNALYNTYNERCRHHKSKIDKIRLLTREYLLVDKKWQ